MAGAKRLQRRRPAPLVAAVERGERAVDRLVAGMGSEIGGAVRALDDRPLRVADYQTILLSVDLALAKVYGPRRGSRSVLADTVADEAARVERAVASVAVGELRAELRERDPGLLALIERRSDAPSEGSSDGR